MRRCTSLALLPMVLSACASAPQTESGDPPASSSEQLHQEIAALDGAAFAAFNNHDVGKLMTYFARDLEFFHDTNGLQSYADVAQGFAGMLGADNGMRRDLIPGTLRVFSIAGYGALETGSHRFCHDENGREDCGVFQFSHVWHQTADGWQISRVLSYGH